MKYIDKSSNIVLFKTLEGGFYIGYLLAVLNTMESCDESFLKKEEPIFVVDPIEEGLNLFYIREDQILKRFKEVE